MAEQNLGERIVGGSISLDVTEVRAFFEDRAERVSSLHPLAPVLYEDGNYEGAQRRDQIEKHRIHQVVGFEPTDYVLDIGCGTGRWIDEIAPLVEHYEGFDASRKFCDIARQKATRGVTIHNISITDFVGEPSLVRNKPTVVLVIGVAMYIDDKSLRALLSAIRAIATESCRIVFREPISTSVDRLTLRGVWSSELGHHYSAIYRTFHEYAQLFREELGAEFALQVAEEMYPEALRRRTETVHYLFVLSRKPN